MRISRTTGQLTWCIRWRPAPAPTTDDATTWVVLTGAPTAVDTSSTTAEPPWLARLSTGRNRNSRWPMVRTIGQPPNAVPTVSAMPHASSAHVGPWAELVFPAANSIARDEAHRLLTVVRAVAERDQSRRAPLRGPDRAADRVGRAAQAPAYTGRPPTR